MNAPTNGSGNLVQRIFFALLPVIATALIGQGVYVLVWGVKIDFRVAALERAAAENSATQSKLDALIMLMRNRVPLDDRRYNLQSGNPSAAPP